MVLHLAQKWKVLYVSIYTLILLLPLTKTIINLAIWKDSATYKESQADTGSRYSTEQHQQLHWPPRTSSHKTKPKQTGKHPEVIFVRVCFETSLSIKNTNTLLCKLTSKFLETASGGHNMLWGFLFCWGFFVGFGWVFLKAGHINSLTTNYLWETKHLIFKYEQCDHWKLIKYW